MQLVDEVVRVRGLSDDALLAGLHGALGSTRRWMALVLVHLAEVEERRLHLLAGYGSMFDYCTLRLGMSEDEACRRIDVARLARQFPGLYDKLASGGVSLTVAALLKRRLTRTNAAALLAAVSDKTVAKAREALVAWFPEPDAPASIRKLPDRRAGAGEAGGTTSEPATAGLFAAVRAGAGAERAATWAEAGASSDHPAAPGARLEAVGAAEPIAAGQPPANGSVASAAAFAPEAEAVHRMTVSPATTRTAVEHAASGRAALPMPERPTSAPRGHRASSTFAPLSPGRFKVTFTADAELKQKIAHARDLLRHAIPEGDLATIVGRALDLLIETTERRRFAKTSKPSKAGASMPRANERAASDAQSNTKRKQSSNDATHPFESMNAPAQNRSPAATTSAASTTPDSTMPLASKTPDSTTAPSTTSDARTTPGPCTAAPDSTTPLASATPVASTTPDSMAVEAPFGMPHHSRYIPNEVRRAVLERDGMRCAWRGPDGTRCNSRAWLEYDHIIPRGRGGADDPANIRACCRAHNRLAAEQAYGQHTISAIIARRRARRRSDDVGQS